MRLYTQMMLPIRDLFPKYTNSSYSLISKQTASSKTGQKIKTDTSPKETNRWPTVTWKDVWCLYLWEKCKWKPQKCITSHWSEWSPSKFTNDKCLRRCGKKRTLLHCWKEHKLVLPLRRIAWRFHKELKIQLSHEAAIPILGIYPERMKTNSKWYMHPNVFSSTIYTSQNMAAT